MASIDLPKVLPAENSCKGLVFRGYSSFFPTKNGVERREGIRLLKKQSCPGCTHCGGILESIWESIYYDVIMPKIENGKEYMARFINVSTDWETGYVDEYQIEIFLREVK